MFMRCSSDVFITPLMKQAGSSDGAAARGALERRPGTYDRPCEDERPPSKKMKHTGPSDGVAARGAPEGHRRTAGDAMAALDAAVAARDALGYIQAPLGDCALPKAFLPEDYASPDLVREGVCKVRCPAEVEHGGSRGRGGGQDGGGGGGSGSADEYLAALDAALSQLKRAKAHHACWVKSERADPRKSRELNKQTTLAAKQAYAAQLWRAEVLQQEARFTEDAQPPRQRLLLEMSRIQYINHLIKTAGHLKIATSLVLLATRQLRNSSKKENIRSLGAHVLLSFSFSACNTSWTDTLEKIHGDIDRLQPKPRNGPFDLKVVILIPLVWFSSLPPPPAFGGLHRRHGWAQLRKLRRALFLLFLLFLILFLLILLILLVSPSSAVQGVHRIRGGAQLKKTDGRLPTLAPGPPRFP